MCHTVRRGALRFCYTVSLFPLVHFFSLSCSIANPCQEKPRHPIISFDLTWAELMNPFLIQTILHRFPQMFAAANISTRISDCCILHVGEDGEHFPTHRVSESGGRVFEEGSVRFDQLSQKQAQRSFSILNRNLSPTIGDFLSFSLPLSQWLSLCVCVA